MSKEMQHTHDYGHQLLSCSLGNLSNPGNMTGNGQSVSMASLNSKQYESKLATMQEHELSSMILSGQMPPEGTPCGTQSMDANEAVDDAIATAQDQAFQA